MFIRDIRVITEVVSFAAAVFYYDKKTRSIRAVFIEVSILLLQIKPLPRVKIILEYWPCEQSV